MSDAPQEVQRICWSSCFPFITLFRAFKLSFNVSVLGFVFCGIVGTYVAGRVLDGVWPSGSQPIVQTVGGQSINELKYFVKHGRSDTTTWRSSSASGQGISRAGAFSLLFDHVRGTANGVTAGVFAVSPGAIAGSVGAGLTGVAWLFAMHPIYAVLWTVIFLGIWAYFGGAAARVLAIQATKDERIGIKEAAQFARKKLLSFVVGPILPFAFVGAIGVLMVVGGLVGAIPAIGEVLVGALFFLSIIGGLLMAFLLIGGVAGFSMAMPTIAVEGSDAFDAFTRSFAYVYSRPWKAAFYGLVAACYGAVCLWFVKQFVRIALWGAYTAVGLSMNLGSVSVGAETKVDQPKLEAIWQGPSLVGATTFYGGFEAYDVSGMPAVGRFFFRLWIYGVYGLVAALSVSLYLSSSTLIYLLLRREVDATDLEEVFTESVEEISGGGSKPTDGAASKPDEAAGSHHAGAGGEKKGDSLASLPVVGQPGG